MKTILIDYQSKKRIGELHLKTQPRDREWVEIHDKLYFIHRIVHTENAVLKLIVMAEDSPK